MPLGMEVGLGPVYIVLDGDTAPLPKKGAELGMEVGLSAGDFVLDGDPAPSQKEAEPLIFGPRVLWPYGCMDQDATWYGCRPRPRRHCVRWRPSSPSLKGAQPPNFRPMSVVAKRLDGLRCHLVWR